MKYTKKELAIHNRRILDFMGVNIIDLESETETEKKLYGANFWKCNYTPSNKRTWLSPGLIRYHKNWDWLMPVIFKINSLQYEFKLRYDKQLNLSIATIKNDVVSFSDKDGSKTAINSAYYAIIKFLSWYYEDL